MDCLKAREIISEAFDRGVAEVPEAAEAREHCRSCAECRRFVEGLAVLRKTPSPAAPVELVESIIERGRMMAEAGVPRLVPKAEEQPAEDADRPEEAPVAMPSLEAVPRPVERDAAWWVPRMAVAGVAVAVASFALVLSFQGFRALRPQSAAESGSEPTRMAAPAAANAPASDSASVKAEAEAQRALLSPATGGPRYISLGEEAYAWLGVRSPDPASMTALDTPVTSSLDSSSAATQRAAWRSKSDADIVFVRSSEASETYVAFRRVVRTYAGKFYSMWAGDITAYGQWPALPSQFSTPTAADGSPTFVSAGKDDSGLEVFAPAGASPDAGFAVAPNTSASDPAGGDPRWTWWLPKR